MVESLFGMAQMGVLGGILLVLIRADRDVIRARRGYLCLKIGVMLVLFGAFMNMAGTLSLFTRATDRHPIDLYFFLEQGVGYTGGFTLLGIGLWFWLSSFHVAESSLEHLDDEVHSLGREKAGLTRVIEREIRQRKTVEAELLRLREHWLTMYKDAPIPIMRGSSGRLPIEWNSAFAEMLGYASLQEMVELARKSGGPHSIWQYRIDAEELFAGLQVERPILGYETRLVSKDGAPLWVRMDCMTTSDAEGGRLFYCFADDVTDRRIATKSLAHNERKLRAIMDAMPVGLVLLDEKTREIVDVNTPILSMTGFTRKKLIGQVCCDFLCKGDASVCLSLDEDDGRDFMSGECDLLMADGSSLPVLQSVSRVMVDNGPCLLEAFVDISEQKRLEHLKEDVDRIVAHDLKAPILGMINACNVLLMDEEIVQGDLREILKTIEQQGRKVLRMAGMAMTVYKMEAGTYEHTPTPVNFMMVVTNVLAELQDVAASLEVTVDVDSGDERTTSHHGLHVLGQEMLYESMFANLLKNAIEASPRKGTVTVDVGECDAGIVRLCIRNAGVIPLEIRETFFEKYVTSGKVTGTGLGTYSARLVVKTVGGDIQVNTSDTENQTSVVVTVPCA
ncbi:PAS domain-containing sensor histidine kinase [Pseudodesulfovibrio sp. JC047]|uniref:PAS domain-containing sensor histidine kinase n=1 Tax=Pseudodesulfovibrio sp. JC047 TaxID=2683199 RepID=UPI0013D3E9FA|nr:PAS domain-containing sensor histidine kinase [Pseudodesulfovibrio sp. JC047]